MKSKGFRKLLHQAQAGDRQAMDRVLEILRPHLEPLARRYADPARPIESTADLLQESCLRAWQTLDKFVGGQNDEETFAMFRGWVGQIVRWLSLDGQRARGSQRRSPPKGMVRLGSPSPGGVASGGGGVDPQGSERSPSTLLRGRELDRELCAALDKLPDQRDAEIVRMHIFDDLTLAEISRNLDLGYDLVREHYWATMHGVRRELKGWR